MLQVLGQQPYSVENQLEACGGAGPGAASKAAAANMTADLGPATCEFAVNTLGKMHGMGGNKAWVSVLRGRCEPLLQQWLYSFLVHRDEDQCVGIILSARLFGYTRICPVSCDKVSDKSQKT